MQIVIDIPDDFYERVNKDGCMSYTDAEVVVYAFYRGKVLPKGHGRLIDADALEARDIAPEAWYSPMWGFEWVDIEDAPTVIKADKEVDDADNN